MEEDTATLAESGVSDDAPVLAIFHEREVTCSRAKHAPYGLNVRERAVVLDIPDGTTEISAHAFTYCLSLASVRIPNSVTKICSAAFHGCSFLTNLTIPVSVSEIGEKAFSGCSSLTSLTLPGSVGKIGSDAFAGCASLASLTISGAATHPMLRKLSACSSLVDLKSAESPALWESFFKGCPLECRVVQR